MCGGKYMKYFRLALLGMVIMFCPLCSCSPENTDFEEQETIEEAVEHDETAADEGTPIANGDGEFPTTGIEPDNSSFDDEDEDEEDPPDEAPVVPSLQINELRTEIGSNSRAEFIEFKMLSTGNLAGLRVFIASNYKNPLVYEFLPVRVKEGEYVVLHLRTLSEECRDEYGKDLSKSGGADSSPTVRDFWISGNAELLRKSDAIYITDQDDHVLDAVVILDKTDEAEWPKLSNYDFFSPVIEFLFNNDAWKSADGTISSPADAVDISGIGSAITRSVSRDETAEDTNTAADWYVTANNGVTIGVENKPRN